MKDIKNFLDSQENYLSNAELAAVIEANQAAETRRKERAIRDAWRTVAGLATWAFFGSLAVAVLCASIEASGVSMILAPLAEAALRKAGL